MIGRPRKYPKSTGYCVYVHVLPNKDIYVGMTKDVSARWRAGYKGTSLGPFVKKYGWNNIEHIVVQDGLTKAQAEVVEDWFIVNATRDGFCINKQRSGGIKRDNPKEYKYIQNHSEKHLNYMHSDKRKEYMRNYMREYYKKNAIK